MLREGLNRIRDLIAADINKGQLGTGGTAATENDTGLETADAATLLDITVSTADKLLKADYTLPSTGGTTCTYKEFEVQKSATPVNYDRIVITGIDFTNAGSEDIVISKRYFIKRV